MAGMAAAGAHSRNASGTSWLPDSAPLRVISGSFGAWTVTVHGVVTAHYDRQGTKRGATQLGVTDWEMLMAMRPLGGGTLQLRAMTSFESFTLGGSGYPLLLQTGGTFRRGALHDRQHPHRGAVEVAAQYARPIGRGVTVSSYAGAVGEPALGPVSYRHRPSAANDPFAPLGHHWQDAAHQSFGVVTAGLSTSAVRIEGSAFNAREADETRPFADFRGARLDSYAGRVSWAATPRVVAAAWWGYLNAHQRLDPTTKMHRYGASVIAELRGPGSGRWSSTLIWSENVHHHGAASHALLHGNPGASPNPSSFSLLAESNLEIGRRSAAFMRAEYVQKNGAELGFLGGDLAALYAVRSVVAGFARTIGTAGHAEFTVGARGSVNFVPGTLLATYGTRTPSGFAVFASVRPHGAAGSAAVPLR